MLRLGDEQEISLGNHSMRRASNEEFPALEFVEYLRSVGVDDL